MRRLARILLNAATAVSLVLFAATAVLWARSYLWPDSIYHVAILGDWRATASPDLTYDARAGSVLRRWLFGSADGALVAFRRDEVFDRPNVVRLDRPPGWNTDGMSWVLDPVAVTERYAVLGLVAEREAGHCEPGDLRSSEGYRYTSMRVSVPHWVVMLGTAALPLLWLRSLLVARRTTRRLRAHVCPACGYDLRATPERCPECGTVPNGM